MDVFAEEAVGADEDIYLAGCGIGDDSFVLAGCAEATDHVDDDGVLGHALAKSIEVLLAEDGGGDEDGDLFTGEDGFEGGSDGDFCFSEADVAAD